MHLLLQLSLACSIIAGCSTQNRHCYHRGQWYQHGRQFRDECNTCWCSNAYVACTARDCGGKPGECPTPEGPRCVDVCFSDRDCPGVQKCCFRGCGHSCAQPNNWQ